MTLAVAVRTGEDFDGADGIDADFGGFPQAHAGAEAADRFRGRDAAGLDVAGEADAAQLALFPGLVFARGEAGIVDRLQRRIERGAEIAGVVGHDDRRLIRKLRDKILAAQFRRIDLQLPRRGFHHPFEQIARFGPARAAIGVDRRGVGVDSDDFRVDRRDVVLARQQRRVEIGRHCGGEQRHVGAEIGVGFYPQGQDLVVLVERHLRLRDMVAAMRIGEEGFRAIAGPFHRATYLLGGPQRHHFFRIDVDLGAETAADIRRHYPQLVLLRDVVEC